MKDQFLDFASNHPEKGLFDRRKQMTTRRRPSLGKAIVRGMEHLCTSDMALENGRCVDVLDDRVDKPEVDLALDYIRDLVVWMKSRNGGDVDE